MNNTNGNLRSERGTQTVNVRFKNQTQRKVELIWIDFNGIHVTYELLEEQGGFVDITTFMKHPWIATDYYTGDRLLIENEYVFSLNGVEEQENRNPDLEQQIVALITLPLYSLRYITLLSVWKCLKNGEDANKLDLPKELVSDLRKVETLKDSRPEAHLSLREYISQLNAWM